MWPVVWCFPQCICNRKLPQCQHQYQSASEPESWILNTESGVLNSESLDPLPPEPTHRAAKRGLQVTQCKILTAIPRKIYEHSSWFNLKFLHAAANRTLFPDFRHFSLRFLAYPPHSFSHQCQPPKLWRWRLIFIIRLSPGPKPSCQLCLRFTLSSIFSWLFPLFLRAALFWPG